MRLFLGRVETLIISYLILYFSLNYLHFSHSSNENLFTRFYTLYLTLYTEQIIVGGHPWSNSRREIISAGMNFFGPLRITHLESSCDGDFHDHTSSMRSRPPEVILSSDFGSKGQITPFFLVIFHDCSCSTHRVDSMILTFHLPPLSRGHGLCDLDRIPEKIRKIFKKWD